MSPAHATAEMMLRLVDVAWVRGRGGLVHGPVFIVGSPRSGTTLVYQLLTQCFQVSYISNAAYRFYKYPAAASLFCRKQIWNRQIALVSTRGKTEGPTQPHEADKFWKQWFPADERPVGADYLSEQAVAEMRNAVSGLQKMLNGPFVNKHVGHSVRMLALNRAFPSACFIWVVRDRVATAGSILHARQERASALGKAAEDWWSAQPRELHLLLEKPLLEQVCGQVFFINKNIEEDVEVLGKDRCLTLEYERLCREPAGQLRALHAWLCSRGVQLSWRTDPPEQLRASVPQDQELVQRIRRSFAVWDNLYQPHASAS